MEGYNSFYILTVVDGCDSACLSQHLSLICLLASRNDGVEGMGGVCQIVGRGNVMCYCRPHAVNNAVLT